MVLALSSRRCDSIAFGRRQCAKFGRDEFRLEPIFLGIFSQRRELAGLHHQYPVAGMRVLTKAASQAPVPVAV